MIITQYIMDHHHAWTLSKFRCINMILVSVFVRIQQAHWYILRWRIFRIQSFILDALPLFFIAFATITGTRLDDAVEVVQVLGTILSTLDCLAPSHTHTQRTRFSVKHYCIVHSPHLYLDSLYDAATWSILWRPASKQASKHICDIVASKQHSHFRSMRTRQLHSFYFIIHVERNC